MRQEENRERDERQERMVSSLLTDFKCLEYGEYILEELTLVLKKSPGDMRNLYREATFSMQTLVKMLSRESILHKVRIWRFHAH